MNDWRFKFDSYMLQFWGISSQDAGLGDTDFELYADLEPREAALVYGEEHALDRIDHRR